MIFGEHERGRPNDQRPFLHKKILGAVSKVARFLPIPAPVAGILGGITGKLAGSRDRKAIGAAAKFPELTGTTALVPSRRRGFRPGGDRVTGDIPFTLGPLNGCDPPLIRSPAGNCIAPTSPRGAELFMGEPTMGQYGAATIPGTQLVDRAVCGRGQQLGNDGLCYNKSQITNKQRMWPAGRKPLLSGGDMSAISTAAKAGRRMDLATKRLQKMGMMKKPARRATTRGHQHARPVAAVSV